MAEAGTAAGDRGCAARRRRRWRALRHLAQPDRPAARRTAGDDHLAGAVHAADAERALLEGEADVWIKRSETLKPTLRPTDSKPPTRQGNYAFRWFATPERHWTEFLDLCAGAWPGFEKAYDSQVIGLWQASGDRTGIESDEVTGAGFHGGERSLLLTRRPNLAMWERSKLPEGKDEAKVRDMLSRRYDLCDWTVVSTATLLTARDKQDTARWT